MNNAGNPSKQIGNDIATIYFVQHLVPTAGVEIVSD
jgi:hypothetical protein